MLKCVLFDMDGVIVDSMQAHADCWIKVFEEINIKMVKLDILLREGMGGIESIEDILKFKGVDLKNYKIDLNKLLQRKIELFKNYNVKPFSDIKKILNLLKDNNIKMGLVTGSSFDVVEKVLPEDIKSYFDTIITSSDVKKAKPNPDPYLAALKSINAKKNDAIVVENAPMGIKSAKSAGLYCIAICSTLPAHYLKEADLIVENHQNLFNYFFSLTYERALCK